MTKSIHASLILISALFIAIACSPIQEEPQSSPALSSDILTTLNDKTVMVVEYICPDTSLLVGKWSNDKAEDKTAPIYGMQLSSRYFDWENPTSGGAIHINSTDEIEVYQFTLGMMYMGEGLDENGDIVSIREQVPQDTSILVDLDELILHVGGVGFGNPTSVLVTSEYDLKKSASLKKILNTLCASHVEVFYLLGK